MSAGVLRTADWVQSATPAADHSEAPPLPQREGWSPDTFAREQIRGLVRQVFFANGMYPVRQVVFTAADSGTDVGSICRRVGETLAAETMDKIVVVGQFLPIFQEIPAVRSNPYSREDASHSTAGKPWHQAGIRSKGNLWFLPEAKDTGEGQDPGTITSLHTRLWDLRREFAYSIIEAKSAAESSEAAALGQLADGVILVLSARTTRRETARKIKETLDAAQARLLGTVLSDRTFPIPGSIYRRL